MPLLDLSIACADYDRTRPLLDGRVPVPGCRAAFADLPLEQIFDRAFHDAAFDVAELSFGRYVAAQARGSCAYIAVPAFPFRSFRHGTIYVRDGITRPEDLRARRLGVASYAQTAVVVGKGILLDHGVSAAEIHWVIGDLNELRHVPPAVPALPDRFRVAAAPAGKLLTDMLERGELDGIISIRPPSCFGRNGVHRLFEDPVGAEKAYYSRTRIFPIMHAVGIRKALVEEHPWIATSVFTAFEQAKELALAELFDSPIPRISHPWMPAVIDELRVFGGRELWAYGLEENNRAAIEVFLGYALDQGLLQHPLSPDDLFTGHSATAAGPASGPTGSTVIASRSPPS